MSKPKGPRVVTTMRVTPQINAMIEEVRAAQFVAPSWTEMVETLLRLGYAEWVRQNKRKS